MCEEPINLSVNYVISEGNHRVANFRTHSWKAFITENDHIFIKCKECDISVRALAIGEDMYLDQVFIRGFKVDIPIEKPQKFNSCKSEIMAKALE